MKFEIEYGANFKKELKKLDKQIAIYILRWIDINLKNKDPLSIGAPLKGNFKGKYRYRISNYRLICEIKFNVLKIILLTVEKRDKVYKK